MRNTFMTAQHFQKAYIIYTGILRPEMFFPEGKDDKNKLTGFLKFGTQSSIPPQMEKKSQ